MNNETKKGDHMEAQLKEPEVKETHRKKLYDPFKLEVEIELIEPQLGTVPKDDEVYTNYIKHRAKGKEKPDEFKSPLTPEQAEEKELRGWTGFMEDERGVFILNYMIKGFLKHAANVLRERGANVDIKNAKSKIDDYIFIFPRKLYFDKQKGDGYVERPLRAMTMQGPRVSLVKSDYIPEGAKLKFTIESPYKSEFGPAQIEAILGHGKYMGLGQFRNGGYGQFIYKITYR